MPRLTAGWSPALLAALALAACSAPPEGPPAEVSDTENGARRPRARSTRLGSCFGGRGMAFLPVLEWMISPGSPRAPHRDASCISGIWRRSAEVPDTSLPRCRNTNTCINTPSLRYSKHRIRHALSSWVASKEAKS
jgi:hypothetical protein